MNFKISRSNVISQKGFTLVELAIVMIIIGLLIGGILKGQELVENARITATVAQVKGIDAAISTFRDKYQALPGDINNPGARIPGCLASAVCNLGGNGDGLIRGFGAVNEPIELYAHLSAANLLSDATYSAGGPWLATKLTDNAFFVTVSVQGVADLCAPAGLIGPPNIASGIYVEISASACVPALTPSQAYRIDSKLDDGAPGSGSIRAESKANPADCGNAAAYLESSGMTTCSLDVKIQN